MTSHGGNGLNAGRVGRLSRLLAIATAVLAGAAAALVIAVGEVGASHAAVAAEFPALTGRVVDNAGLIEPDAEEALTRKLEAFEAKSSDQVVVVTIDSLEGAVLEDYANRLFRHWGLGQAGEDNGVLLLVAKNDRKIRIEVGYGLEGVLSDALAKLIIENALVPAFRAGEFSRGISEGAELIIQVLSGDKAELEARARRNAVHPGAQKNRLADWLPMVFAIFWFGFVFSIVAFSLLAPVFGRKTGKNRYKWLGMETTVGGSGGSGRSGGFSGGGFSGGGGSSGGGGASGSW